MKNKCFFVTDNAHIKILKRMYLENYNLVHWDVEIYAILYWFQFFCSNSRVV